jgi:ribosomal protein S18 acetylase RimI-like enzyme
LRIKKEMNAGLFENVTEAELGVDAKNESAAFSLYERLGYKTVSVDTWFRKEIEIKPI